MAGDSKRHSLVFAREDFCKNDFLLLKAERSAFDVKFCVSVWRGETCK